MSDNTANLSLVIRLGFIKDVDFYEEHSKLIKKQGYVDLCVFTKRQPNMKKYNETVYIKESKKAGDRIFKAKIIETRDNGEVYPKYYDDYHVAGQTWLRIDSLDEIELNGFYKNCTTLSGKEIKNVFKSSTTLFGVIEKQ